MLKLFVVLFVVVAPSIAQDAATLKLQTVPENALVFLDSSDTPEPTRTPYENPQMIPGAHLVHLEGPTPIYRSADFTIQLKREETIEAGHTFAFRNKSFLYDALPVAPGVFSAELGFQGLSNFAYYNQEVVVSGTKLTAPSHMYGEKNPGSMMFPLIARLGFPSDFEVSLMAPLARKNFGDSTAAFGLGNLVVGSKFLIRPIQSAIGLQYSMGGAEAGQLGQEYSSLGLSFSSLYGTMGLLLQSNLAFRYNFDKNGITPGNDFEAYLEVGYPISIIRPLLGIGGTYHNSDAIDTLDLGNAAYELRARPGAILELGKSSYMQLGIPVSIPFVGKNRDMVWGLELSFRTDFQAWSPAIAKSPVQAEPKGSEETTSNATPIKGSVFVLFSQTEVSNKQFREFVKKTGAAAPENPEFANMPNYFEDPKYDDYPVVGVSWSAAQQYAAWVGKRLPKQQEWLSAVSTLDIQTSNVTCGTDAPASVLSMPQGNQLFHVIGNVSEWLESDNGAPNGPKIHAGGSFVLPTERCLNASKLIDFSSGKGARNIGFRVIDEIK